MNRQIFLFLYAVILACQAQASPLDSLENRYSEIVNISRRYASEFKIDSLLYCANLLDSIGKTDSKAIDSQFQVYNFLCRTYMADGKLELAMNIAISQRLLVEKTGNTNGQILSAENMGLIYMLSGQYKNAIVFLEKSLSLVNEKEGQMTYKLRVAESLIRTYIYQSELEKAERLLEYYEDTLDKIE